MATPRAPRHVRSKPSRRRARRTLAGIETLETRLALAQTVGLFVNAPGAQEGYTLFNATLNATTHLIDNNGQQVHTWTGTGGATSVYLQDNGSILRNTILAPPQRASSRQWTTATLHGPSGSCRNQCSAVAGMTADWRSLRR